MASLGHRHTVSVSQTQNHKAQLANAYNELGKELSSQKIRVVGNYTLGKVIGEGTYGKVRLGVHRLTGTRVAIKQIPKAMSASLTREIHHHRQLHHPHITQLYEVIATETNVWLVTELCSGGELYDYLFERDAKRMNEEETRIIFGQLCLAVAYLHSKGIVHRDLKLENVLLDEHCCVKLGDFGFTREFERGRLLETFCGTTGYASPEMLLAKKYLGPEVDIWSLGVILYVLLTGGLPFDDDNEDEQAIKDKVIKGEFEDPEWLSDEARDLIKNILQVEPEKRPTIAQILEHPWFKIPAVNPAASQVSLFLASRPPSPSATQLRPSGGDSQLHSALSGASDTTYHTAASQFPPTEPSTPDRPAADVSETTADRNVLPSTDDDPFLNNAEQAAERAPMARQGSSVASKIPPAHPSRTPARTKRRSVSSIPSDPKTPAFDRSSDAMPPQDFSSLLSTPAPIIFSTQLERDLLNSMSMLGLDIGQIVHSVLSDACDATGALWWMTKRKTEKRALEQAKDKADADTSEVQDEIVEDVTTVTDKKSSKVEGDQTPVIVRASTAPELQFVPPTPVAAARPETPPRSKSPNVGLLSPTPSTADISVRSHPSTPGGSVKDKDGGSKGRKVRSGSVSIMQRATTALEAAGLVRKKSAEGVRADKEGRDRSVDKREGNGVAEESRASQGSGGSGKALKSPPSKAQDSPVPTTPPPSTSSADLNQTLAQTGSPWVLANSRGSPPLSGTDSPRDTLSALPNIRGGKSISGNRNRASLLNTFRMWFREDTKGKRKEELSLSPTNIRAVSAPATTSQGPSPGGGRGRGSGVKRRASGNHGRYSSSGRQGNTRSKRTSMSSRRSSSVASHRSSIHSTQFPLLDSPTYTPENRVSVSRRRSDASRRSIGSRTPNSEREDFVSRPSSIQSFNARRHRKSPSASSAGSMYLGRTNSPLPKNHSRRGSGSSTRVLRQVHTRPNMSHLRSNSASSVHSLASSRPNSFYEPSESESRRNSSPNKPHTHRSLDETPRRAHPRTTFVASKRTTPLSNPSGSGGYLHSFGRSSWKKSWGLEPPGWQTRAAYPTVEVLAISPPVDGPQGIRDVFSGRHSLSMGDESDWVDEDDDGPGYAGGLGQLPISASLGTTTTTYTQTLEAPLLSPAPKGPGRSNLGKRTNGYTGSINTNVASRATRSRAGRSPGGRSSPLPSENKNTFEPQEQRGGRRQLPAGRSGPAFRLPIQEEDEDEEEE